MLKGSSTGLTCAYCMGSEWFACFSFGCRWMTWVGILFMWLSVLLWIILFAFYGISILCFAEKIHLLLPFYIHPEAFSWSNYLWTCLDRLLWSWCWTHSYRQKVFQKEVLVLGSLPHTKWHGHKSDFSESTIFPSGKLILSRSKSFLKLQMNSLTERVNICCNQHRWGNSQ